VVGCCEQGESLPVIAGVPYLIDPATGPYHEILIKAYLQVLGAQAIVISGPQSTDKDKAVQAPERFDAMFPSSTANWAIPSTPFPRGVLRSPTSSARRDHTVGRHTV
jgi:hypothetical protein